MSAAAAASAAFPRLEKYELLEEIGHGGMATVYRAKDPRLGREVAVKLIHRHLRENAEVGTRFVAEARAAAKLRHPAIVEVFDVSNEDDPERYLVVELVRGTTLRKVLQQHRDMPAEVGAAIVRQLCEAVEHAHACSIIHRDIKPENVLVELPQDRLAVSSGRGAAAVPRSNPSGDRHTPASGPERLTPDASEVSVDRTPLPGRDGGDPHTPGRDGGDSHDGDSQTPSGPDGGALQAPGSEGDTQASPREAMTPQGARPRQGKSPAHKAAVPRAKPVDPGVVIKITDFGIAKILDAQGVTSTGQVLGSPAHMAPEQIEGGDVDSRTDVFALGVLLYECLVGHLPFEGKNPAQVLRRVLEGAYPAVDRERSSTGGRWARVVAGALAHDPNERTASAAQLGEQIQAELDALGVSDGRAEIAAYFADPAAYVAAHQGLLVPRLTARGEAARKAGDVWGAAADWNRALALAPDDLAILKRIASLTSSAGRRILLRRAALILAGSAALGVGAFAVARTLKGRAFRDPDPMASASVMGSVLPPRPDESAVAPLRHAPVSTASATVGPVDTVDIRPPIVRIPATPTVILPSVTTGEPPRSAGAVATSRVVKFNVTPKGARLAIDGVERNWFGVEMQLPVGTHTVEAIPKDPTCCRKTSGSVTVASPPADKPADVQSIYFHMDLNPAGVTLAAGAPKGGQLYCSDIGLTVPAGKTVLTRLREPLWEGSCSFTAPDRPRRVGNLSLRAGESKTVPWPD